MASVFNEARTHTVLYGEEPFAGQGGNDFLPSVYRQAIIDVHGVARYGSVSGTAAGASTPTSQGY